MELKNIKSGSFFADGDELYLKLKEYVGYIRCFNFHSNKTLCMLPSRLVRGVAVKYILGEREYGRMVDIPYGVMVQILPIGFVKVGGMFVKAYGQVSLVEHTAEMHPSSILKNMPKMVVNMIARGEFSDIADWYRLIEYRQVENINWVYK